MPLTNPMLTIFNKMDMYESKTFDEWLQDDVRQELLRDLRERWEHMTEGNCIFISATEKQNIDGLRDFILKR